MKLRKVTSLTSLFSFLVLTLTSVVLYIEPQGRVAYWADWRLWGLDKEQWGDVHINSGVLFLLAAGVHVWLNWGPVTSYLKDRARRLVVFTPDSNLALALTALFVAGTLAGVPPFSWITGLSAHFKDQAALKYGEPPYGHAELSTIRSLAEKTGLDPEAALASLAAAGYRVSGPGDVVAEAAKANGVAPNVFWKAMGGGGSGARAAGPGLPPTPPAGVGRMPLAALCEAYGLDLETVLAALRDAGIEARGTQTLKELGTASGRHPEDLYNLVRDMP